MSERHDFHYVNMDIQPYAVFRSMGILKEYLVAAALKYIMRADAKNPDDPRTEWLISINKAIAVLEDLKRELINESEVPF